MPKDEWRNAREIARYGAKQKKEARADAPQCPICGEPMTVRHPANRNPFWGCMAFPECKGSREM